MSVASAIAEVMEIKHVAPHVFYGALGFYLTLFLLFIPKFRSRFLSLFLSFRPATQSHLAPLNSLREFAALGIAAFHTWLWLQPFYSKVGESISVSQVLYKTVPLFAILSGFLIYRSLEKMSSIDDFKYYAKRRILRIYPLYIVSIFAYLFLADFQPGSPFYLIYVLPETFMMKVFGHPSFHNPVYWSLYVEELFYLFIPTWVVLTRKWPALSAGVALFIFSIIGNAIPDETAIIKYFFMGILLCEFVGAIEKMKLPRMTGEGLTFLGLAALYFEISSGDVMGQLVAAVLKPLVHLEFDQPFNPMDPYRHYYTFTLGVGFSLVIAGVLTSPWLSRITSLWPLRFLGTISYSLFVWNGLILVYGTYLHFNNVVPMISAGPAFSSALDGTWVSYAGMYLASFIFFASISYLAIERPFLFMKSRARTIKNDRE